MAHKILGKIVSLKNTDTLVVEVERYFAHPIYKKRVKRNKRFKADYKGKDFVLGQTVEIVETRPFSKDKHYKVLEK